MQPLVFNQVTLGVFTLTHQILNCLWFIQFSLWRFNNNAHFSDIQIYITGLLNCQI